MGKNILKINRLFFLIIISTILFVLSCPSGGGGGPTEDPDTVQIVGISPTKGVTNINLNRQIQIRFSGNLDDTDKSGTITLDDMTFSGNQISIKGDTITINPPKNSWDPDRRYQGLAIENFKGIASYSDARYYFHTKIDDGKVAEFGVESILPESGSTDVEPNTNIVISFNYPLNESIKGRVILYNLTFTSNEIRVDGNSVIVNTGSRLDYGQTYRRIAAYDFKGADGRDTTTDISTYQFSTKASTTNSTSPGNGTPNTGGNGGGSGTSTSTSVSGPVTTLPPVTDGIYITKIEVQSERGEWANKKLVIFGDFGDDEGETYPEYWYPPEGYWPFTYEMATIKGTVSNDLKFEYVFNSPLRITGRGVFFEGWIIDPSSGGAYGGAPNKLEEGNSVPDPRDGRIYLANPKDGKSYIIYQNMYNGWSWELKSADGGGGTPGTTPTTIPTTGGGGGGGNGTLPSSYTLEIQCQTNDGEGVFFTGNFAEAQNGVKAVRGDWTTGHIWKVTVTPTSDPLTWSWFKGRYNDGMSINVGSNSFTTGGSIGLGTGGSGGGGGNGTLPSSVTLEAYCPTNNGEGVYFTGNFAEGQNNTKAVRGTWNNGHIWKVTVKPAANPTTWKWYKTSYGAETIDVSSIPSTSPPTDGTSITH